MNFIKENTAEATFVVMVILFFASLYVGAIWSYIPTLIILFITAILCGKIFGDDCNGADEGIGMFSVLIGFVFIIASMGITAEFFVDFKEVKTTKELKVKFIENGTIVAGDDVIKDEKVYWQCRALNCKTIDKTIISKPHSYNTIFNISKKIVYEVK